MRIRYFSDLHLEFLKPNKIERFLKQIPTSQPDEICILAGDIGNPHHTNNHYDIFMKYMSVNFKKTFVIPGNHEYYHRTKTMEDTNAYLENYFQQYENISFLNNRYEHYENHCFIGTTLWSKITNPIYEINDVECIPQLDYIKYNRLNRMCIDFLEDAVETNNNCGMFPVVKDGEVGRKLSCRENDVGRSPVRDPTGVSTLVESFVIITHHMPSSSLIDVKYKTPKMLPYNQWFYCDMDEFMTKNHCKIRAWFYGHTHTPSHIIQHGIPLLCNPIGYPNENPKVDFSKHFEI